MSQSAVKSSRREIRRVIGATGVEMLNEHLIRIGKLEARCEALEQVARLQREAREALEARLDMEIPISTLSSGGTLRAMSASIARMSAAPAPTDEVVSRILQFEAPDNEPLLEAGH